MDERRQDNRRALFGRVVIQILETGEMIKAKGYDISHYGMSIRYSNRLKPGYTYIIRTKLNDAVFEADCQLIAHYEMRDSREFKIAFEYVRVSPRNRTSLDGFVK